MLITIISGVLGLLLTGLGFLRGQPTLFKKVGMCLLILAIIFFTVDTYIKSKDAKVKPILNMTAVVTKADSPQNYKLSLNIYSDRGYAKNFKTYVISVDYLNGELFYVGNQTLLSADETWYLIQGGKPIIQYFFAKTPRDIIFS